jgi:hypothetical protein
MQEKRKYVLQVYTLHHFREHIMHPDSECGDTELCIQTVVLPKKKGWVNTSTGMARPGVVPAAEVDSGS